MEKKDLRRLTEALYCDAEGTIYISMKEFLARHQMADTPQAREAVLKQIQQEFGNVPIVVADEEETGEEP